MNDALLSVITLASAIAPPKEGSFGKNTGVKKDSVIQSPSSGAKNLRSADSSLETEKQRKERLLQEGVRQAPPKAPERDYLSVLKSRPETVKARPNLPPLIRMNFGYGSWFPLQETAGRRSVPLGVHHVGAQLWAWGADSTGSQSAERAEASYSSLSLLMMSTSGEVSIPGYDKAGQEIRYTVQTSDLDTGFVYKYVFQRPLSSSDVAAGASAYQFDFGLSLGYLPLRQRYMKQFGSARARDKDYLHSGPQWNASSGLAQVSLSFAALSLFEAGIFFGVVSGFPFELKAWGGLEIAFRAARQAEEEPETKPETKPEMMSEPLKEVKIEERKK